MRLFFLFSGEDTEVIRNLPRVSAANRKNNLIGSVRMKSDVYEAFISVPGIQSVLEMSAAFAMNLAS